MMLDRGSCSSLCGSTFSRSQTRLDEFETWRGLGLREFLRRSSTCTPTSGIGVTGSLPCVRYLTISNHSRISLRTKVNLPASSKSQGSSETANLGLLKTNLTPAAA
jgi:hypothetical protein